MVDDTPDDLVFELHNEALWGPHPYGYSILGTRDTVSSLRTADLRALHERAYHPSQLIVAASGNVEHDACSRRCIAPGGRRTRAAIRRGSWSRLPSPSLRPDATCRATGRRRTSSSAPRRSRTRIRDDTP